MPKPAATPVSFASRAVVEPWATKDPPVTKRGERTRQALVRAARTVFERDGFINSRLSDITTEANCSSGSFYTYFESKEEVLVAVMESMQDDMMHPGIGRLPEGDESIGAVIEASNRAYIEAYRRNARLMMLLEQVATLDPMFAELRLKRAQAFAERNAAKIRSLQEAGLADSSLDPRTTSWALSSMISRLAYLGLVLGEPFDWDELVGTITTLWLNALRVPEDRRG